jgi:Fe-S cluster assembly scaffold protein SufB
MNDGGMETMDTGALLAAISQGDPLGFNVPLTPAEKASMGLVAEAAKQLGIDVAQAALAIANERIAAKAMLKKIEREGGIVVSLEEALRELPEARRHAWSLISPISNRYTAATALAEQKGYANGYVVYIPKGTRITTPIYMCLLLLDKGAQLLHNIIIMEENTEATIITGCGAPHDIEGSHIGVTEIILGQGAALNYAMIHRWNPQVHVRPRTAARIHRGARLTTYYAVYGDVASLHTEPHHIVQGGILYSATLVVATGTSVYHVGALAHLTAPGSSARLARD